MKSKLWINRSIRFLIIFLAWVACLPTLQARGLMFEERVTAQRAIEEVYWRHRIWPEANPGAKPPLDQVMPESVIRAKVEDSIRESVALERFWQRPITAEELQAEMKRIAHDTQMPDRLGELFAALGDDPFLIAECLVRPIVTKRILSEEPFASDSRFRAWWEAEGSSLPAEIEPPSNRYPSVELRSTSTCQNDSWTPMNLGLSPGTTGHVAVWTGSEMILWAGEDTNGLPYAAPRRYDPVLDSWRYASPLPPGPYGGDGSTAIWTGTRMIVWGGGYFGDFNNECWNTGAQYNPASNTWVATSTGSGVPSPRLGHTAVWTGTRMVIWGGAHISASEDTPLNTGGQYDPVTDTWVPTSVGFLCSGGTRSGLSCQGDGDCPGTCTGGAVPGEPCTVTDPSRCAGACSLNASVRCNVNPQCSSQGAGLCNNPPPGVCATGTCQSLGHVPSPRAYHTAVWTGSRMIVWGGGIYVPSNTNTGALYDPASDTWAPTSTGANVPSARSGHEAVWTGSAMIVWGGYDQTGGRYDPVNNSWTPTSTVNAPSPRGTTTAVWTGSEMIVWGGSGFMTGVRFNTGGRYNPASDTWTPTSTGANVPAAREFHSAVWTGSEMFVWGGATSSGYERTGGRYCATSSCQVATWYHDADGDGYGNSSDPVLACTQPAGYAPAGGDCNEANGSIHPNAIELCDGIDNNCDGTTDNPAPPPGSAAVSAQFEGGMTELSWTSLAGATGYDLVRGNVSALAGSHGNFTLATDACLANDLAATNKSESGIPAAGEGVWYLVRGTNCGGAGTYDSGALSQVGSRDAEIQASPSACP